MVEAVQIELSDIGKRFKHWIFRGVNLSLKPSVSYGMVGYNGVGKSTLLRIISGYTSPSVGQVVYKSHEEELDHLQAALAIGYAAPYISLIDELTVQEMVHFHTRFKRVFPEVADQEALLQRIELYPYRDLLVGDLSSGLMQRLKVGLMILSQTPILLLDEPTSYLDITGKRWYHELLEQFATNRLIVIASNDPDDVVKCDAMIDMLDYAQVR